MSDRNALITVASAFGSTVFHRFSRPGAHSTLYSGLISNSNLLRAIPFQTGAVNALASYSGAFVAGHGVSATPDPHMNFNY